MKERKAPGRGAKSFWHRFVPGSARSKTPDLAQELKSQVHNLRESRRAIVQAFEIERRRIEADLHDGAQQFLVASGLKIGEAAYLSARLEKTGQASRAELAELNKLLEESLQANEAAVKALRRSVHEVHPKILDDLGLEAGVRALIAASALAGQITLRIPHRLPRLPAGMSSAAYFFICEVLTNAAKYAPWARVSVLISAGSVLRVSVLDEGDGGASILPGHGLSGLRERLRALGGDLELSSPPGGPTTVQALIPLPLREGESALVLTEPGEGADLEKKMG